METAKEELRQQLREETNTEELRQQFISQMAKLSHEAAIEVLRRQWNSEMAKLREEIQQRVEAEAEQRRIRAAKEQELLAETIIKQFQEIQEGTNRVMDELLSRIELKFEHAIKELNGKATSIKDSVPTSIIHTEKKGKSPPSNFPSFSGENPTEWRWKCQTYFELYQVPDVHRTRLATLSFEDDASEWYHGYLAGNEPPEWDELVRMVLTRFKKGTELTGIEQLEKLSQNGTIEEYRDDFERVQAKLLMENQENRHFSNNDFVDIFISGLKDEIKHFVKALKPKSLEDAFEYSVHMEKACEAQFKRMKEVYERDAA